MEAKGFSLSKSRCSPLFYSKTWSFSYISVWNARKINTEKYDEKDQAKILLIKKFISKYKPLLFYIIDVGKNFKEEISDYDFMKSRDEQNILYINRNMKCVCERFLDDGFLIDKKILCLYYKPQDKLSKKYMLFNYLYSYPILTDLNLRSHKNKIILKEFRKRKIISEPTAQVMIFNSKGALKKKSNVLKVENNLSDHYIVSGLLNVTLRKKNAEEIRAMKWITYKKKLVNEYTNEVFERCFHTDETNSNKKNIKRDLERINVLTRRTKKVIKNDISKAVEYAAVKLKESWKGVLEKIRNKIEYNTKESTFKTIKKLWRYTSREIFQGTYLKKEYVKQYAEIEKSKLFNSTNSESIVASRKKKLMDETDDDIKELTSIANKLNEKEMEKDNDDEWLESEEEKITLDKVYNKWNTEAIDYNLINPYNFNKLFKKELMKYTNMNTKYFLINKYELWLKIFEKIWNVIKNTNNVFKTFFLNKLKGVDSIDNFRILLISPIGLKVFEEFNYYYIKNWIQKQIDYLMFGCQFGFRENFSTYNAIEKVKTFNNKETKVIVLIDLSRAYEHVDRSKIWKFLKLMEVREKDNLEILFIIKIIKIWLIILKNMTVNLSNEYYVNPERGVPMGSKYAPLIFNLFMAIVLHSFILKEIIAKGNNLAAFADDLILAIRKEIAEDVLLKFEELMKDNELIVNSNKCEILYNEELDIEYCQKVLEISNKFNYPRKKSAKYLGKYIRLDKNGKITSSEEDIVFPKNNMIYINKIPWDIQLEYLIMLVIGKKRYEFVSEINKKLREKYVENWRRKISIMRKIKKISVWEVLNIIRFIRIDLFNALNKKIEFGTNYDELVRTDNRFEWKEIINEKGEGTGIKIVKFNLAKEFNKLMNLIKEVAIKKNNSRTSDVLRSLWNQYLKKKKNIADECAILKKNDLKKLEFILTYSIEDLWKDKVLFIFSTNSILKRMEISTMIFKKDVEELNLFEKIVVNTILIIVKPWKCWRKIIKEIFEEESKYEMWITSFNIYNEIGNLKNNIREIDECIDISVIESVLEKIGGLDELEMDNDFLLKNINLIIEKRKESILNKEEMEKVKEEKSLLKFYKYETKTRIKEIIKLRNDIGKLLNEIKMKQHLIDNLSRRNILRNDWKQTEVDIEMIQREIKKLEGEVESKSDNLVEALIKEDDIRNRWYLKQKKIVI